MLRAILRGLAALVCIGLLVGALSGSPIDPAPAYAGGSTGIPPPPDSTPGATYPSGDDDAPLASTSGTGLLYWVALSTLAL